MWIMDMYIDNIYDKRSNFWIWDRAEMNSMLWQLCNNLKIVVSFEFEIRNFKDINNIEINYRITKEEHMYMFLED